MVQQHKRRRRKRRYLKKDIPIVVLAAITIILLFVWGGLYWSESSEKKLLANANTNTNVKKQSLTIGETLDSSGIISEPEVNGEVTNNPNLIQSTETNPMDSDTPSLLKMDTQSFVKSVTQYPKMSVTQSPAKSVTPSPAKSVTPSPAKPNTPSPTKANTASPAKPVTQNPTMSDTQSPTKSDTPIPTQNVPPSTNHTENSVDPALKYEQEITRIQEKCSLDKNAVLNTAENSFRQLDMRNPAEIQVWRDNLTTKLITAESTCETAFQEQIHLSENDSVSVEVIDKWRNTYNALKLRLKEESESKLQILMAGG